MARAPVAAWASLWLTCGAGAGPAPEGENADFFWRQGYLWKRGLLNESEVEEMRQAMAALVDAWEPGAGEAAPSPLRSQERDHGFMLDSATKASIFLETSAIDVNGSLQTGIDKSKLVRKVAHGLHLLPGPWRIFVHSAKVAELIRSVGWRKPVVAQTLYRFARPQSAGVDRHQDSVTLYTEPPSVLGVWLALEDADEANGCLHVLPGSHRGPIRERLVRRPAAGCSGEGCPIQLTFVPLNTSAEAAEADFLPLRTQRGDVVVMHGTTEHFSKAGTDPERSRESLQVHLVEKTSRWPEDNWLQYPAGREFEEIVMPSGRSPFSEL